MKALLVVVVLLVVGVVGLGFYRGWFNFTVDQDKFQEDRKAAAEGVQDLGQQAKDKVTDLGKTSMDGTLVSVSRDKLTMTDKEGKEHSHTLAVGPEVTCDGVVCKAADLKAGMRVRVTTSNDAPHAATRIEALDRNAAFE